MDLRWVSTFSINIQHCGLISLSIFSVILQLGAYMTQSQMHCCASATPPVVKGSLNLHIYFLMED